MSTRIAIAARNAELDALSALLNTGYLRIYSGAQPATPETAVSGTLLAELRFGATAFPASSGGVITANAITADSSADNTGTAGYFRCLKSDGTTAVYDGAIGTTNTFTVVAATDVITTAVAHGLSIGDQIRVSSTTTLPGGLAAATTYFVKTVPDSTSITISATSGGSTLDITSVGTGTHTYTNFGVELVLPTLAIAAGTSVSLSSLTVTDPM